MYKKLILIPLILLASSCTITDTTSTTSGSLDAVTPDVTLNRFVDVRIASIRKEAAAGEGENLDALAILMDRDSKELSRLMNSNYEYLFNDLGEPAALIGRIENLPQPRS